MNEAHRDIRSFFQPLVLARSLASGFVEEVKLLGTWKWKKTLGKVGQRGRGSDELHSN